MKSLRLTLVVTIALILSCIVGWGTTHLVAQNPSGESEGASTLTEAVFAGVPSYSVMKTENNTLPLTSSPVNAFAPIAGLPCPASAGANGCTIRVTVTSQFRDLTDVGQMNLTITGPGTLGPANFVNVSTNSLASSNTHSMQWVKRNVPAGSTVTITVQFSIGLGTGNAGLRTMSIDLFNGLI